MNAIVTRVLQVILDVEFDGNVHFYVCLDLRPKSGQGRSNKVKSPNTIFCSEASLPCPVLTQDSKNDIYFDVRLLEMPKTSISK